MGPVLILALALQGVWCLHASAVRFGSQLAIFVGESGAGKSTLASYLHQQSETGWQRVADDILPVANSPHSGPGAWRQPPVALPYFPQLKLPPSAQMTNPRLEQIPIAAVYQLVDPTEEGKSVSLRQLAGREAISALLSHTMAARLMPPDLLQRHMDFCAGVSQVVSIWELSYPHLRSSLLEAQVLLAGQLAG